MFEFTIPSDTRNLGKFCVRNFSNTTIEEYSNQSIFVIYASLHRISAWAMSPKTYRAIY